jgi:hypothetical protein
MALRVISNVYGMRDFIDYLADNPSLVLLIGIMVQLLCVVYLLATRL